MEKTKNVLRVKKTKKGKKQLVTSSLVPESTPEILPPDEEGTADPEILKEELDIDILPANVPSTEEENFDQETASSRDGKLVVYDPLEIYLREISKYSMLSREEEHELAVRFLNNKDKTALYKLVTSNLWLAVKIARDYEKAAKNLLDLIQEGNMGLLEAIKNFDPYRDVRLPSYAVWWIKAYIIRYIMANWRLVKIGTTQAQRKLFFNLRKEKEKLEKEGFAPATKLLAERLDVRESDVVEMEQRMGSADTSMDSPINSNESETNLFSLLPSDAPSAEELLQKKQLQSNIRSSLKMFKELLNKNEKTIFENRIFNEDKATLQDLSSQLKISKERVRQIEERVRAKLKEFLKDKLDVFD